MSSSYQSIDDQTVAYILLAQKCFEDLKQVAAQLAGLLVLEAAGSKEAAPDHPMLNSADQLYRSATDGLRAVQVSGHARRHYDHLLAAMAQLGDALRLAKQSGDALVPLRAAYQELRSASRMLPGFQMVAFEQGCCG